GTAAHGLTGQTVWNGVIPTGEWEQINVDLERVLTVQNPGAARNRVVLCWDLGSDASTVAPGWYVDNVRIGDPAQFQGIAPVVTSLPTTTGREGLMYTYFVTGYGTPSFTVAAPTKPAWLSVDPEGLLFGVPA